MNNKYWVALSGCLLLTGCATTTYQCGGNTVQNGDTMVSVQQTCGAPTQYRRTMTQSESTPTLETDWLYPQESNQALQLSFSQNKLIDGETMNMDDIGTGWQNFGTNVPAYGRFQGVNQQNLEEERNQRELDRTIDRQVNKAERTIVRQVF